MSKRQKVSEIPALVKTTSSCCFKDIHLENIEYVDKSELLLVLFDGDRENGPLFGDIAVDQFYPGVCVTAAKCFGKSLNLDMVGTFVNREIDIETGKSVKNNLNLFNNLAVMKNEKFVNRCYGSRPVIRLNFFCNIPGLVTISSAKAFCMQVVDMAYEDHKYLKKFAADREVEANDMEWFTANRKDKMELLLSDSIRKLAACLFKFHGRRALILVDEYDSLLYRAYESSSEANLNLISNMVSNLLAAPIRYHNQHVSGIILTGISRIAGVGLSSMIRIEEKKMCRFLDDGGMRHIENFYGLTFSEVESLLKKYKWSDREIKIAKDFYNGYVTKTGTCLFNAWSILHHLEQVQEAKRLGTNPVMIKPKQQWANDFSCRGLIVALKLNADCKEALRKCIVSDTEIKCRIIEVLEGSDLLAFRRLVSDIGKKKKKHFPDNTPKIPKTDLIMTFLLEQGCLSYSKPSDNSNVVCLKIPNAEVKTYLARKLSDHYCETKRINLTLANNVTASFKNFCESVFKEETDTKVHEAMKEFKYAVGGYVSSLQFVENYTEMNHDVLKEALFFPLYETGFIFQTEIVTLEGKKPEFFMYLGFTAVIIELKFKDKKGLHQIFQKEYYSLFSDKKHFSDSDQNPVKNFILLDILFDSKLSVSVRCIRKKDVENLQINLLTRPLPELSESQIDNIVKAAIRV